MKIIIIIAAIWFASAVARALYYSAKERKRQAEAQRRAAEIERIRYEWHEERKRNAERTAAMIALQKEQMRQAKEQERQRKEQERQAEVLRKHEKRITDLEYRVTQAEADIEFLHDRIAQLDAQRDYLLLQQSGTVPGGKEHTKYQTKIISIENQIHTAENKLSKAQHIKTMAERELSA